MADGGERSGSRSEPRGAARREARGDVRHAIAHPDPALRVRVVRRVPMTYARCAAPALDRGAHVRAGSGLAWLGERLAVVQDDANFIALVDPATGLAEAVPLPAGEGGLRRFDDERGNKAHKLDLEAFANVGSADAPCLVALGSGSSPRRESVVVLEPDGRGQLVPRVHAVPRFYATLRRHAEFAGSELNVEGALFLNGRLRLFQRGNGEARDGRQPVNATCDIDWRALVAHLDDPDGAPPPAPRDVVQWELGAIAGTRLTFTDATPVGNTGGNVAVVYTASAEASPDAVRDGEVAGSAIGIIAESDGTPTARWTALRDEAGEPLAVKAEGVALDLEDAGRAWVVVDVDAHDRPSELYELRLEGTWA